MSEFKTWFCPEHGPNSLVLWSSSLKDTSYSNPWLSEIDEQGALIFRFGEEDWEDTGPTTWTLACNECDWKEMRADGQVYITTETSQW